MAFSKLWSDDFDKKEEWGRKPSCPPNFGYLKGNYNLLFFTKVLMVISICNLRTELLYLYIFIIYIRGFAPVSIPKSLH